MIVHAINNIAIPATLQFGPALLFLVFMFAAKPGRSSWAVRHRKMYESATTVQVLFACFSIVTLLQLMRGPGSLLLTWLGYPSEHYSAKHFVDTILFAIVQAALIVFASRATAKRIQVDDWLDWPEFADKDFGVVKAPAR